VARGLTRFVGRDQELAALTQALAQAAQGQGQLVALLGEAGVGKSRLVYELVHSHRIQGWRVLESASVSYGKATPYFPVIDLLKHYAHVEDTDDARTIRAKVTGQVLTLDETLQDTLPALFALLDVLPDDNPFRQLDPPQRRQRTLTALKRVLLRESQVQPLLLVFEDLHWIDSETQAWLDRLVESLPTAHLLLLVNYRPEYQHGWGSKTFYTQVRLDPLPPASAEAFLAGLLGDDPSLAPLLLLLMARTAGNPFFLEESVRTLVETTALVGTPGAYRLAAPLQDMPVPATVQAVLAQTLSMLGAFTEGRRHGEEALRLATLEGQMDMPIVAHAYFGLLYLAQGDLEHVIRVFAPGLALGRASGDRNWLRTIGAGLGYTYVLQGRLVEGHTLLEEAISESISTGSRRPVRWTWLSEGCRLGDTGKRPCSTHARRSTWPGSRRPTLSCSLP
jgi:hypothetical protein